MDSTLLEKVAEELEMLESIYSEDKVVAEPARHSMKDTQFVECNFNL